MTESEKDVMSIREWCGNNFPFCFDVVVEESNGTRIVTEISGGKDNKREESYEVAESWDDLFDMASKQSKNKRGFRIVSIFNYQTKHPIFFAGQHTIFHEG